MKNLSKHFFYNVLSDIKAKAADIRIFHIVYSNSSLRTQLQPHLFLIDVQQKVNTIMPLFSTGMYHEPTKFLRNAIRK